MRVTLTVASQVLRGYVAVSDPVPGGLRSADADLQSIAPPGIIDPYKIHAWK